MIVPGVAREVGIWGSLVQVDCGGGVVVMALTGRIVRMVQVVCRAGVVPVDCLYEVAVLTHAGSMGVGKL